jgi:NADPH:quinone reductase-like Zn-dependent oxidoreductase
MRLFVLTFCFAFPSSAARFSLFLFPSHGVLLGGLAGAAELARRRAELRASHSVAYHWAVMRTDGEAMASVGRLAASGALAPHIGRVLPLAAAAEAHALVESGAAGGKVVLRVDGDEDAAEEAEEAEADAGVAAPAQQQPV